MNQRANALAERLEEGARSLAAFAFDLTEAQWQTRVPGDGRKVGVVVHHVASAYAIEMQLALMVAAGKMITDLAQDVIDDFNARHARDHDAVTKRAALALLAQNSAAAADAIRELTDEELDRAVPVSLYGGAPVTCQFVLEDHAVRHSYHHLAKLRGVEDMRLSAA